MRESVERKNTFIRIASVSLYLTSPFAAAEEKETLESVSRLQQLAFSGLGIRVQAKP
jgi:hypothetical protein